MNTDKLKSNRISDDSGVVCFNSFDDPLPPQSIAMEYSTSSTTTTYASLPLQYGTSSVIQYSSGQSQTTSEAIGQVKRRAKKNNYVIGSGIVTSAAAEAAPDQNGGKLGKYGSKRLSHVQQMRLRFENLCKINNNNNLRDRKCQAADCKGGVERRTAAEKPFESLPIIHLHDEDSALFASTNSSNAAADDSSLEVSAELSAEDRVSEVLVTAATATTSSDCECDDNDDNDLVDWKSEGELNSLPTTGPLPISGEIEYPRDDHRTTEFERLNSCSDFEEDHEVDQGNDPLICEVKNAELCDLNDEDDFEEVALEDNEEIIATKSDNTRPDSLNKTFTNLLNIVDELLSCEQTYIQSLEVGIRDYKTIFREPEFVKTLPDALRGQEGVIFGNIDRICDFHRDELLPKLLDCDRNVTRICEVFCDFIQRDFFYKYVLYAMNRTKSEHICSRNTDFFKKRQVQIGDRLGLNSFLVKPIQRLPHYKMLFNQMIVELLKNIEDESLKPLIAICCKTEKYVQKLLDTVNESMHINDIEECYEFNILQQGKFRKMDMFDIYEKYSNYRYKGRLFLFDKSLVYTEQTNKNRLVYKGHFLRTKIGLEPDRPTTGHTTPKPKLILFSEKLGQQCIEVTSDSPVIFEWKSLIDDIIRSFMVEERERLKRGKRSVRSVSLMGTPITPELRSNTRGSIYSTKSLLSDVSSLSSGSDRSSKISVDSRLGPLPEAEKTNRRTTWDDRKHVEKLLNSENNFLRMFVENKRFYIDELPDHVQERLHFYVKRFDDLYWFHTQLSQEIGSCSYDVEKVCELFKTHLKLGNFEVYNKYAVTLGRAEGIIEENNEPVSSTFYSDRVTLRQFLHLAIKKLPDYLAIFKEILDESFSNGGTMTSLFKNCAVIEVEMSHLYKRVSENQKLYALKDDRIHYKIHGMIEYSEMVAFNALNVMSYKLLLTKSTLICVNIRSSAYKEKFLSIFFIIPLKHLTMKESKVKPNRLKFASAETRLTHRLIFAKQDKKQNFQKMIVQFQRKIFRLD